MTPAQDACFRATTYRAPPWSLPIGAPCPDVGADCWAFVTSWNPDGVQRDDAANGRDWSLLHAELDAGGWRWQVGEGVGDDGTWSPEPSVLVLGMTEAEAVSLGRRWRQVAVVVGERGGVVRLVACDET